MAEIGTSVKPPRRMLFPLTVAKGKQTFSSFRFPPPSDLFNMDDETVEVTLDGATHMFSPGTTLGDLQDYFQESNLILRAKVLPGSRGHGLFDPLKQLEPNTKWEGIRRLRATAPSPTVTLPFLPPPPSSSVQRPTARLNWRFAQKEIPSFDEGVHNGLSDESFNHSALADVRNGKRNAVIKKPNTAGRSWEPPKQTLAWMMSRHSSAIDSATSSDEVTPHDLSNHSTLADGDVRNGKRNAVIKKPTTAGRSLEPLHKQTLARMMSRRSTAIDSETSSDEVTPHDSNHSALSDGDVSNRKRNAVIKKPNTAGRSSEPPHKQTLARTHSRRSSAIGIATNSDELTPPPHREEGNSTKILRYEENGCTKFCWEDCPTNSLQTLHDHHQRFQYATQKLEMCKTDHPNLSQFRILQLCDVLPAVYDRQKKYLSDVEQMIATYPTLHNLWANRKTIPFVVRGRPTIAAQIIPAKSWCREYDRVCALEHAPNDSDDSLLEVVPKRHRVASRVRKFEARRDLDDPPFDVAPPPPRASSREREIQARRDLNETPRYVPSRVRETQGREDSDDSSKDVEPKRRRVGSGERDFNISGSLGTSARTRGGEIQDRQVVQYVNAANEPSYREDALRSDITVGPQAQTGSEKTVTAVRRSPRNPKHLSYKDDDYFKQFRFAGFGRRRRRTRDKPTNSRAPTVERSSRGEMKEAQGSEGPYEVEYIRESRVVDGELKYLVHWRGYSSGEATWEPLENLGNAMKKVSEFKRANRAGKRAPLLLCWHE